AMQVGVRATREGGTRAGGGRLGSKSCLLHLPRSPGGVGTDESPARPMIRVRNLRVSYPLRQGLFREILGGSRQWAKAVDGISFDIRKGEVLSLVGESGCGKTSTWRAILKLTEAT